ncbi:uncharacterized protein LOC109856916 [Pseudomyrmex gracilis]|uniref:uncharacterized protein LOC109856916 n=1 Tax=Pseudomyrmex gracilis TaxID=219809 RepID=UPI000994A7C5|nr:uncharacterized protein LOC109856916 [Pseudomyrmex gracilis]XP_020288269.1 uncharacterized protein LOC109856916 [Pseudomyrmex gracilis]XP_020288270.1 uncharacterized protein LOC109856916 [Pseudomyrmex gracilis]XP_020288271.1 uncharacterized protein LOC109856916 [Pseudomyrmex gracilis]
MSTSMKEKNDTSTEQEVEDSLTDRDLIDNHEKEHLKILPSKNSRLKPQVKRLSHRLKQKRRINYNESDESENDPFENPKARDLLEKLEDIKEQEKVPLSVIRKLEALHVKLIHKVPPQHKIEQGTATYVPTKQKTKKFQKYGPLRKGRYSSEEDEIIKKNWNTFCELHNWDSTNVKPFLNWKHEKECYIECYIKDIKERQKFVQFLANGLPWRTLYSVYRRFKILYRNKLVNARYGKNEDEVILLYIKNKQLDERDNKYTELAKLLNRTTQSISKRYQYLQRIRKSKAPLVKSVKYKRPNIEKKTYIKTLLDVTLSEDISDLKFAILPKLVWKEMEKKLNIDHNVLKTFWQYQLHIQLFSTRPIYLSDIKIQLIEYIYVKGISNVREISWSKVASHFDGATPVFLCKVFYYLVQECRKDIGDKNFIDIMEYLYNTKIDEIKNASYDFFLPRILYKDDKLVVLDKDNNNATIADIDKYDETYSDSEDSGDENNL